MLENKKKKMNEKETKVHYYIFFQLKNSKQSYIFKH